MATTTEMLALLIASVFGPAPTRDNFRAPRLDGMTLYEISLECTGCPNGCVPNGDVPGQRGRYYGWHCRNEKDDVLEMLRCGG